MSLPKDIRLQVWTSVFGKVYSANCQVCSREINVADFEAGHIQARAKGGLDTLDNLAPICRPCNIAMKTTNLYAYKARFYPGEKIKSILPLLDNLDQSDLIELKAYLEYLMTPEKVPTLLEQEKSAKSKTVERQNQERDVRAERRNRLREETTHEDVPELTRHCKHVFSMGTSVGKTCNEVIFDNQDLCPHHRSIKTMTGRNRDTYVSLESKQVPELYVPKERRSEPELYVPKERRSRPEESSNYNSSQKPEVIDLTNDFIQQPTNYCKYIFLRSDHRICGNPVFDYHKFCTRCRTKKTASKQID